MEKLKKEGLKSRLILQIHDELLVETRDEERDKVMKILTFEMENAAKLSVPLEVEAHEGNTWYETKSRIKSLFCIGLSPNG